MMFAQFCAFALVVYVSEWASVDPLLATTRTKNCPFVDFLIWHFMVVSPYSIGSARHEGGRLKPIVTSV